MHVAKKTEATRQTVEALRTDKVEDKPKKDTTKVVGVANDATPLSTASAEAATTSRRGDLALAQQHLRNRLNASVDDAVGEPQGTTDATRVAVEHFDAIDTNGNGYLSKAELEAALEDPSFEGEAAAAVAALYAGYDDVATAHNDRAWFEKLAGISMNDLRVVEDELANGRDVGWVNWRMRNGLEKIEGTIDDVFGPGGPSPDAVRQGSYGDCFFHAALAGLAAQRPEDIENMIHDNEDGTYTVTFPGRDPITIDAPTDAELALGATSGENGQWVAILEKAYRQDRGWAADLGGSDTGIGYLTGNDTQLSAVPLTTNDQLIEDIQSTLDAEGVVVAGIGRGPFGTDVIPDGHAYTVTAYDPETGLITVRNPWGRGEPVGEDGQALDGNDDGYFTLTLEEFRDLFTTIGYEQ